MLSTDNCQRSTKQKIPTFATVNQQLSTVNKEKMHIEAVREYCLAKKGTTEEFPFDENTLVFKVMGKMYALVGLERSPLSINLKCDPERAIQLREEYPEEILEGYHMNKKHWNTVRLEESLDGSLIVEMIEHSYDLVVSKMTKKLRGELEALED